jgi:hypothetical protein
MMASRIAKWRAGMALVAGLALLAACEMPPGSASQYSRIRLLLTDAPSPEIESAVVWISRAYLVPGEEGESVVVTDEPQEYDLLDLQNGVTALLGEATVAAGPYAQLRLVVDSARLTLANGATFQDGASSRTLKVPSGHESGIKVIFPGGLELTEDVDVVVDFDVAKNFVFQGPPAGPHSVLFTPVLKGTAQPSQPI